MASLLVMDDIESEYLIDLLYGGRTRLARLWLRCKTKRMHEIPCRRNEQHVANG